MGFRFRRSLRLMPGLRLNFSRSGPSVSVGTRGAWATFGHNQSRYTVGLPGTGMSYTTISSNRNQPVPPSKPQGIPTIVLIVAELIITACILVALS